MTATALIALDASARTYDADGRLHVSITNISKANVCGYLGSEIPDGEALGLDAGKIYQLYRDPAELEAAAATFNNLPLLSRHVPVSADDPQPHLVVGSTGTDAVFEAPFLRNSLVVWDAVAIAGIESGEQKELSAAYRYTPVMEPGEVAGVAFDGRMTRIVGNHVALVEVGRAGADVVVGDHQPKEIEMAKKTPLSRAALSLQGALTAYLVPKLAQDAKLDVRGLVAGVTSKNYAAKRAALAKQVQAAAAGKLAQDADLDDLMGLLDAMEAPLAGDDMNDAPPPDESAMDEDDEAETEEEKADRLARRKAAKEAAKDSYDDDKDAPMPKPDVKAMDAAIEKLRTEMVAIREAEKFVRPWVGELAVAQDSAEGVYRAALDLLGVPVEDVHPSALRPILAAQPKPGAKAPVAMDHAAAATTFVKTFPGAARVKHV